ncbi:hypothetical protein Tco_0801500 [Tanacetum coccineum]|uniref:Uncharacterized protein n=1 Tax=Tanacetum coccineum TaxID=301880 RepID=A0ABQ4ZX02_9ASTR
MKSLHFKLMKYMKKDEKLNRYRRIGMESYQRKEQLQRRKNNRWHGKIFKNLWRLINSGMSSNDKLSLGFEIQSNDEVLIYEEEMNSSVFNLSEPNEMSKSRLEVTNEKDVSAQKSQEVEPSCVSHIKSPRQPLKDKETHKVNRKNWNDMMERELGEGYSFTKKKCFVCGSLNHLIKDCDYYEKKMAREAEVKRVVNTGTSMKNMVDRANGYIYGKVNRVGNLDFDSVSFVKELGHFNLFSISQICDKQHKVLFTETECLVVSSDFKMPDENQILLKVPRHHNMYSFDMKTPSPAKGFACLIAKATSDESKLWHRSTARTPQQMEIAERYESEPLFRGCYTMLADSLLPTTFWARCSRASEVTNSAGTPTSIASEEKDEEVELIRCAFSYKRFLKKIDDSKKIFHKFKEQGDLDRTSKRRRIPLMIYLEVLLQFCTGCQKLILGRLAHDDSLYCQELEIFSQA